MLHDDTIREQALDWAVRTGDPAFDDWGGFTEWLEADPAHAVAYDAVCVAVEDATSAAGDRAMPANNDASVATPVSRRWIGGALAAGVAALVMVGVWQVGGGPATYDTAPGETQLIALEDGGSIELAGGSRLVLDEDGERVARLEQGQALFTLRNDAAHPFTVEVGEDRLVDIGTVFDVRTGNGALSVAVSEGAVLFNPAAQNVRVDPGQVLTSAAGEREYSVRSMPLAQIGEWREGRLTFQQASLAEVATDLTRATGIAFSAAPGAATRSVSGSLLVAPLKDDPRALGPLLGVSVQRGDKGWVLDTR